MQARRHVDERHGSSAAAVGTHRCERISRCRRQTGALHPALCCRVLPLGSSGVSCHPLPLFPRNTLSFHLPPPLPPSPPVPSMLAFSAGAPLCLRLARSGAAAAAAAATTTSVDAARRGRRAAQPRPRRAVMAAEAPAVADGASSSPPPLPSPLRWVCSPAWRPRAPSPLPAVPSPAPPRRRAATPPPRPG